MTKEEFFCYERFFLTKMGGGVAFPCIEEACMAERKECPYCGKSFTQGFHGYCGKQCALADRGKQWVEKAEKSDSKRAMRPFKFIALILVLAVVVPLIERFLK